MRLPPARFSDEERADRSSPAPWAELGCGALEACQQKQPICSWLLISFYFSRTVLESNWLEGMTRPVPFPSPVRPPAQESDRWRGNPLHTAKEGPVWVQSAVLRSSHDATLRRELWDFEPPWEYPQALNIPHLRVLPQP